MPSGLAQILMEEAESQNVYPFRDDHAVFFRVAYSMRSLITRCDTSGLRETPSLSCVRARSDCAHQTFSMLTKPRHWVFASPEKLGQQPYWPDRALRRVVRPAAVRAGIVKHIGWHTFRHSFATLLKANGKT